MMMIRCDRSNHTHSTPFTIMTTDVQHIVAGLGQLSPPTLSQAVHREECTQCFDSQDSPLGIDLCLTCFNGGCLDQERHHAHTHSKKTGHQYTLNIKRNKRPKHKRVRASSVDPLSHPLTCAINRTMTPSHLRR